MKNHDGEIFQAQDQIELALELLEKDSGALYREPILSGIRRLYESDPSEFARLREKVKSTRKISMQYFDQQVSKNCSEEKAAQNIFPESDPWPEPVDPAALLDEIERTLARYVVADVATLRAAVLWIVFTWFIDAVQVAPIANITAPEKRCGKSILLTVIGKLAYRPLPVSNTSTAALFRAIEKWSPTLLIDEVDSFLRENEEARGILNAGFEREMAYILRCEGEEHTPTRFNVWGAKVLCGIGKIQDTLDDRSISLILRRKLPGEKVESIRRSDPDQWAKVRSKLARLQLQMMETVRVCAPETLEGLHDRANDCWEPLLQVAYSVGGDWPAKARYVAHEISGTEKARDSASTELLRDIQAVFALTGQKILFTQELIDGLMAEPESRWATWNRGKPLSARQLSDKLSNYRIRPNSVRKGDTTKKGYHLRQFSEAFDRYLDLPALNETVTPSQPKQIEPHLDFSQPRPEPRVPDDCGTEARGGEPCGGVTPNRNLTFI